MTSRRGASVDSQPTLTYTTSPLLRRPHIAHVCTKMMCSCTFPLSHMDYLHAAIVFQCNAIPYTPHEYAMHTECWTPAKNFRIEIKISKRVQNASCATDVLAKWAKFTRRLQILKRYNNRNSTHTTMANLISTPSVPKISILWATKIVLRALVTHRLRRSSFVYFAFCIIRYGGGCWFVRFGCGIRACQ